MPEAPVSRREEPWPQARRTRRSAAGCGRWLEAALTGRFAGLRGAGGPGREHEAHDERVAWNRHLAAAGWTCLGWPPEHGGRGATLAQQVIFHEEYARSGAPGPGRLRGRGAARPDADRVRHAGAAAPVPAADRGRHRAVVPGLLRAGRRVRPGRGGHHGHPRRRRVGDHRAEGVDVAGARGRLVLRAGPHRAGVAAQYGPVLPARADAPAGDHGPPDPPAHRHVRVQRGVLRRGPHAGRPGRRRARRRLAGGPGHAGHRARGRHPGPADRVPARARGAAGAGPATPGRPRTRCCATGWPGPGSAWRCSAPTQCARWATPARPARVQASTGASEIKLLWSRWHQDLGELAMDVARRPVDGGPRRALRPHDCSGSTCSAGPTRSTAGPTRSSGASSPSARSACRGRPGHDRQPRGCPRPRPGRPARPRPAGRQGRRDHRRGRHRHRLRGRPALPGRGRPGDAQRPARAPAGRGPR